MRNIALYVDQSLFNIFLHKNSSFPCNKKKEQRLSLLPKERHLIHIARFQQNM